MAPLQNVSQLIGKTPIVRLKALEEGGAQIYGKLESKNHGGSVKDRIALFMINDAERSGKLKPGMTIVEPTSGNTGIGLAMIAAERGYSIELVMPETMTIERRKILSVFGAKLVLTEGPKANIPGAIERANEIAASDPEKYFMPQQFENPANVQAHRETTAAEILQRMRDRDNRFDLDAFVAGVGTGGTITGVGQILREREVALRKNGQAVGHTLIVAVEPSESPVLSGGERGKHGIQGIGAGIIPKILDRSVIDVIEQVTTQQAFETKEKLAHAGFFPGISSGAAVAAAQRIAKGLAPDKKVLAMLPDTGERYLSVEG